MKTLYLECNMGAAGDMLMAALLELLPDRAVFLEKMNALGLPGISVRCEPAEKCGIHGSRISVSVHGAEEPCGQELPPHVHAHPHEEPHVHAHPHGEPHVHAHPHEEPHAHAHPHEEPHVHAHPHAHYSYEDICNLIGTLDLPDTVKKDAYAVYRLIGEAESHAHGAPIEQIHFHEVGSLDAVADVIGCCLLIHLLAPEQILASPVHVGSGHIHCAHGVLPVPAPATAYILRGVPIYGGEVDGELCTPTGAAILKYFVQSFGPMPPIAVEKTGYGMGKRNFPRANCLRAFLGESGGSATEILELSCNLDDMTPEAIGYATQALFEAGALDVFVIPIYMKKNRPAHMLTCLCRAGEQESLAKQMLLHTSTFGVRCTPCSRYVLSTHFDTVQTAYGPIRIKSAAGYGISKQKPEYADVEAAAKKAGVSFDTVYQATLHASRK